jgi:hypothetical protein
MPKFLSSTYIFIYSLSAELDIPGLQHWKEASFRIHETNFHNNLTKTVCWATISKSATKSGLLLQLLSCERKRTNLPQMMTGEQEMSCGRPVTLCFLHGSLAYSLQQ